MVWLPDDEAVKRIHSELTAIFEEEDDPISPAGVKSEDLLDSACSRPHTGMGGQDKYGTLECKVAALFHSLTKNHAFHNGNKRTALVSMLTTLSRNGRRLNPTVTDDTIYEFVLAVTADHFPRKDHGLSVDEVVSAIGDWIKDRTNSESARPSEMKTSDFIKSCRQAGASCKVAAGGAFVIRKGRRSIRISQSTRQLSGMAVMAFLRKLDLSETSAGISLGEFQGGYSGDREQIYRYMVALKRLAKT